MCDTNQTIHTITLALTVLPRLMAKYMLIRSHMRMPYACSQSLVMVRNPEPKVLDLYN